MDLYRPGDLKATYGRGFSAHNLHQMRSFDINWEILQTTSAKLEIKVRWLGKGKETLTKRQTSSAKSESLRTADLVSER